MIKKRVFIIVLDSFGIGSMPDAFKFGDEGANTLKSVSRSEYLNIPNLMFMGLGNIDGVECIKKCEKPDGCFARLAEKSAGKDTTTGHWEIAGLITEKPFPTYPQGFPKELLHAFEEATGRKTIVNRPISGTEVIQKYGEEHIETGALIVYTSADSVFQIAAHEDVVPVDQLYEYCHIARRLLVGEHAMARVIARPFVGQPGQFVRTKRRKDFSLKPQKKTMLDILNAVQIPTIGIGKINDIFAGKGVSAAYKTADNNEGMIKTIELAKKDMNGLVFTNLVDFDMVYGHRNDIDGYAKALSEFDQQLEDLKEALKKDDLLIITADHGCDPGFKGTDHTREYVPMLVWGKRIKTGINLDTRDSFADIGATVLDYLGMECKTTGSSFLRSIT